MFFYVSHVSAQVRGQINVSITVQCVEQPRIRPIIIHYIYNNYMEKVCELILELAARFTAGWSSCDLLQHERIINTDVT